MERAEKRIWRMLESSSMRLVRGWFFLWRGRSKVREQSHEPRPGSDRGSVSTQAFAFLDRAYTVSITIPSPVTFTGQRGSHRYTYNPSTPYRRVGVLSLFRGLLLWPLQRKRPAGSYPAMWTDATIHPHRTRQLYFLPLFKAGSTPHHQ